MTDWLAAWLSTSLDRLAGCTPKIDKDHQGYYGQIHHVSVVGCFGLLFIVVSKGHASLGRKKAAVFHTERYTNNAENAPQRLPFSKLFAHRL